MTDKENTQEVKAVELNSILVDNTIFFPEFKGARIDRNIKVDDNKNKLTFGLPVPKTDEEAQAIYNIDLAALIEKGVKQHSYSQDSKTNTLVKEDNIAGINFDEIEDVKKYADQFQGDLFKVEREKAAGVVKVAKKAKTTLDTIGAGLGLTPEQTAGMTPDELVKLIQESKKKK